MILFLQIFKDFSNEVHITVVPLYSRVPLFITFLIHEKLLVIFIRTVFCCYLVAYFKNFLIRESFLAEPINLILGGTTVFYIDKMCIFKLLYPNSKHVVCSVYCYFRLGFFSLFAKERTSRQNFGGAKTHIMTIYGEQTLIILWTLLLSFSFSPQPRYALFLKKAEILFKGLNLLT